MIPLNAPDLGDLEERYVLDALRSGWVTTGPFVERFEAGFKRLTGRRHAVACSSGTSALFIALKALGAKPGDRVLCQAYACEALAHAVIWATGRPPILHDVDPHTWALRREGLEERLVAHPEIVGVILAHTYGVPAQDTEKIVAVCRAKGLWLVEDGSEAHGASLDGEPIGARGEMAIFSCRGEKVISGGQLGIIVSDDESLARRARQWVENGLPASTVRFWATVPGFNNQPAHHNAALGRAQLQRQPELQAKRRAVHKGWRDRLEGTSGIWFQIGHGEPAWWLTALLLGQEFSGLLPQDLGVALRQRGVETRCGFYGLHRMPHIAPDCGAGPFEVTDMLLRRLLILPSGPTITPAQQDEVVRHLWEIVGR